MDAESGPAEELDPWAGGADARVPVALVGLFGVIDAQPKLQQRGAEVVRRMNEARKRRRLEKQVADLQAVVGEQSTALSTIRRVFPEVAAVCGATQALAPASRALTPDSAVAIIRACLTSSASSVGCRRGTQLKRCESSLTHLFLDRAYSAMFGAGGVLEVCRNARQHGARVIIAWTHEWDETKQSLQSVVSNRLATNRKQRLEQLQKMTALR